MITSIDAKIRSSWQVPDFKVLYWQGKQQNFCIVIPVINEGDRIKIDTEKGAYIERVK